MIKYHFNIQCCVNHVSIVCVIYACLNNTKRWKKCGVILSTGSNIVHITCTHVPRYRIREVCMAGNRHTWPSTLSQVLMALPQWKSDSPLGPSIFPHPPKCYINREVFLALVWEMKKNVSDFYICPTFCTIWNYILMKRKKFNCSIF